MSKQLFKGIKSVFGDTYKTLDASAKKGYIWFVRTPVVADTDNGEDILADDIYDIYFGTKHYGHFQDGQFEAIEARIAKNAEDLGVLASVQTIIKNILGANIEGEGSIHVMDADYATLDAAFVAVSARIKGVEDEIDVIQESLKDFLVKNVAEGDKVLTVADGILSSTMGIEYTDGNIVLTGKNGVEISKFDASVFVKDSFLEDVKVETKEDGEKYIIFTWNTVDNETKTDEIKVSDFAKLYNAGTALELAEDGVTFNVKVAAADNFLTVNGNNELVVDDINANKTMISEEITIKGGPLEAYALEAYPDGKIPANTSMQDLLKALLCVEIYPTTTANTPSYKVEIAAPTITAKKDNANGGNLSTGALVEVGQKVYFPAVDSKAVTVTKTNPTVSNFGAEGYSETLTGAITAKTSKTVEWTVTQVDDTIYTLTPSVSKFSGDTPAVATGATTCTVSACTLTAVEGDNVYTIVENAPEHVGSHPGIPALYEVSNLGGRKEAEKSPAIEAASDVKKTPADSTGTFKVTGVYPIFTNGVTASTTDATAAAMADLASPVTGDGTKLALMKASTSFAVSFAAQGIEPYRLFLPGSWKISTASAIDGFTSKYAIDCKADFKSNGTTTRTIQGKEVTYTVYEWAGKEGANRVKFTVA